MNEEGWMEPIKKFILAQEKGEVGEMSLAKKATKYTIIGQYLYQQGYSIPVLKCLTQKQGDYVLRELHEGVCGYHSSVQAIIT